MENIENKNKNCKNSGKNEQFCQLFLLRNCSKNVFKLEISDFEGFLSPKENLENFSK